MIKVLKILVTFSSVFVVSSSVGFQLENMGLHWTIAFIIGLHLGAAQYIGSNVLCEVFFEKV